MSTPEPGGLQVDDVPRPGGLWKAVRPDGTDFRSGTVDYGAALGTGVPVRHPSPDLDLGPGHYLSVARVPTDCTGMAWPCRLLRVEPVGVTRPDPVLPNKVRVGALLVVGEEPAHLALGPQGEHVAALIVRGRALTLDEGRQLAAAWAAAGPAAWARAAARDAARARAAARDAARDAARAAARAAAWAWAAAWAAAWAWDAAGAAAGAAAAVVVRDLITPEQYRLLTGPWASVVGPAHPDDDLKEDG